MESDCPGNCRIHITRKLKTIKFQKNSSFSVELLNGVYRITSRLNRKRVIIMMRTAELEEVRRAAEGDDSALAALLQRHYSFVYKYLVKVTMDPNLAEEIVQDTMIRCMENIRRYDGTSAFSSWMVTIGTRIYIDRIRRKKREQSWLDLIRHQAIRRFRWQLESRNEEWTDVMDAMTRLTPEHRVTVLLKHYYGYSYDEIGDMLGIPAGTAKSRTAYGLRQLRKELE